MTRTCVPADVSTTKAMSPLVAFVGLSRTVPATHDQASFHRLTGTRTTELDRGRDRACADPTGDAADGRSQLELPVRIGQPSRGSPATRPERAGSTPSGSFTTMPPVASATANSDGVPRRPGSAVTTPWMATVDPTVAARAVATVTMPALGVGLARRCGRRWRRRRRGRGRRIGRGGRRGRRCRRCRRRRRRGRRRRGRRRRRQELEVEGVRDVQAIAGRAGPGAVALTQRARCLDQRPVGQGALAQRLWRHDDPDRTRAVVDR